MIIMMISDAPELSIEENWVEREEGKWEIELVCSVSSQPVAQVNYWVQIPSTKVCMDKCRFIFYHVNKKGGGKCEAKN